MRTALLGLILLLLGTGFVFKAFRHPRRAAMLELIGGALAILGLAAIGAGLALQTKAPFEMEEPRAADIHH